MMQSIILSYNEFPSEIRLEASVRTISFGNSFGGWLKRKVTNVFIFIINYS